MDDDKSLSGAISSKLKKKVGKKLYFLYLLAISLVSTFLFFAINWENIKTFPLLSQFSEKQLPSAAQDKFTVVVSKFHSDQNNNYHYMILESLRERPDLAVVELDRVIYPVDNLSPNSINETHSFAKKTLKEVGAQVLLWGIIVEHDDKKSPKVYWTAATPDKTTSIGKYHPISEFRFDVSLFSDIEQALFKVIDFHTAEFARKKNERIKKDLENFISKLEAIEDIQSIENNLNDDYYCDFRRALAYILFIYGSEYDSYDHLKKSVELANSVIDLKNTACITEGFLSWRADALFYFGQMSQNNLFIKESLSEIDSLYNDNVQADGNYHYYFQYAVARALTILSQLENEPTLQDEAYLKLLSLKTESSGKVEDREFASYLNALAIAETNKGEYEGDERLMKSAIENFEKALSLISEKEYPRWWAGIAVNLADSFQVFGKRTDDLDSLQKAIELYKKSLEINKRENIVVRIGHIYNDLGNTHDLTYQITENENYFLLSKRNYEDAIEAWEMHPKYQARAFANYGNLLFKEAYDKNDVSIACSGLNYLFKAWAEFHIGSRRHMMNVADSINFNYRSFRFISSDEDEKVKCLENFVDVIIKFENVHWQIGDAYGIMPRDRILLKAFKNQGRELAE